MRVFLVLISSLALAASMGCSISNSSGSFSDSSGSISDSISSPSKSSSKSSEDQGSGGEKESPAPETKEDTAHYQRDVTQLAVTYFRSGGDLAALRSGVARLARERGITDWEADADTIQAIGRGAGTAGLAEPAFVEFSKQLVGDDLARSNELRIGYQETSSASARRAPTPEAS